MIIRPWYLWPMADLIVSLQSTGMSLGWFTALAAASGLRVLAVEPRKAPLRPLRRNLGLSNSKRDLIDTSHVGRRLNMCCNQARTAPILLP